MQDKDRKTYRYDINVKNARQIQNFVGRQYSNVLFAPRNDKKTNNLNEKPLKRFSKTALGPVILCLTTNN